MAQEGIFITFEGSEGCGKSTQVRLLAAALEARKPVVLREPGGTPVGEQIRHVLQYSKDSAAMVPEAELLLFAASRAQLVREVILPARQNGSVVISDRFLDSTTVYQGAARKIDSESVARINAFAVENCLPDITFLLDIDAGEGRQRASQRAGVADRMESEPDAFYEAVRRGYLALAEREKQRIVVVDAAGEPQEIAAKILSELYGRFPWLC
jgi:dTMP kinase